MAAGGTKPIDREISPYLARTLAQYVHRAGGAGALQTVVTRAGVDLAPADLLKSDRWYSGAEVSALADAAAAVFGDDDIGRRVGEQLFYDACEAGMADFMVGSGSIQAAMAGVVHYSTKMSDGRVYKTIEAGDTRVVVDAHYMGLKNRFYCGLTAGYYAMVPSLFGMVGYVTESNCQIRGADDCRFQLTWAPDPRPRGHAQPDVETSARRRERSLARFEELQQAASDLVRADDVNEVLGAITERAGSALHAPRYLLAARTDDTEPLRVHHFGFRTDDDAYEWADRLLRGDITTDDGVIVSQITSARRHYGMLAALFPRGIEAAPESARFDQRLLDAYAAHAAAALEVVASLESARRDRDTARALLELSRELARVRTKEEITARLAPAIASVTGCEVASVWLWDAAAEQLELAATHAVDGWVPPPVIVSLAQVPGLAGLVADPRAQLLHVDHVPTPVRALFESTDVITTALVPIAAKSNFVGLVGAGFRRVVDKGPDATYLLERLDGIAHHAATAFENAALLELARYQALHDALTDLPNRPLVRDRSDQALRQASRGNQHVGLLFMDLDRFKDVNDTLGHAAGDELIRRVAARLDGVMRKGDTLARLGGDEFIVLLPSIEGTDEARRVAERLIAALDNPFDVAGEELLISCSIGIACAPDHGVTYDALMRAADSAMYEAKASGRGTYRVHTGTSTGDRRRRATTGRGQLAGRRRASRTTATRRRRRPGPLS